MKGKQDFWSTLTRLTRRPASWATSIGKMDLSASFFYSAYTGGLFTDMILLLGPGLFTLLDPQRKRNSTLDSRLTLSGTRNRLSPKERQKCERVCTQLRPEWYVRRYVKHTRPDTLLLHLTNCHFSHTPTTLTILFLTLLVGNTRCHPTTRLQVRVSVCLWTYVSYCHC